MTLYVVVMRGVYDHGVRGVSNVLEFAMGMADAAAAQELDMYHRFEVRRIGNNPTRFDHVCAVLECDESGKGRVWRMIGP